MSYILTVCILILCLINKKSKKIFFLGIILMWILFGFNTGNADYEIYSNRYYNYSLNYISNSTEILFSGLMKIFNYINLSYNQYLSIISAIILYIYSCFIMKNSSSINFSLLLYMIFPFCIDACQLRFTIATAFILIGFNSLIKNEKYAILKYILYIILAGNFHYAAYFLLIMIIPKLCKKETVIYITIGVIIIGFLFIGISNKIVIPGESYFVNKINFILNYSQEYELSEIIKVYIRMIFFFVGYFILNNMSIKRLKDLENQETLKNKNLQNKIEILELTQKMNIIVLIIFPFIYYALDLYRIQMALSVLNIVTLSYYLLDINYQRKLVYNKKNFMFIIYSMIYEFCNLYLLVLSNPNIDTVFFALFNNNLIF